MSEPLQYNRKSKGDHPPALHEDYITGPLFGHAPIQPGDDNLSIENGEEAQGQRIFVSGRVLDEDGHTVPNTLIEIWQCNAAGRYRHEIDQHPAPLDPHFTGQGRVITDKNGKYKFTTIKPGAYPWGNHYNAWRPAHIHFSLFGPAFVTRLITQMYNSVSDKKARERMVSQFDLKTTKPEFALSFKFDFVLRGREATPFES